MDSRSDTGILQIENLPQVFYREKTYGSYKGHNKISPTDKITADMEIGNWAENSKVAKIKSYC